MCRTQFILKSSTGLTALGPHLIPYPFFSQNGSTVSFPIYLLLVLLPTDIFTNEGLHNTRKYKMSVQEQSPVGVYHLFSPFVQMETKLDV